MILFIKRCFRHFSTGNECNIFEYQLQGCQPQISKRGVFHAKKRSFSAKSGVYEIENRSWNRTNFFIELCNDFEHNMTKNNRESFGEANIQLWSYYSLSFFEEVTVMWMKNICALNSRKAESHVWRCSDDSQACENWKINPPFVFRISVTWIAIRMLTPVFD